MKHFALLLFSSLLLSAQTHRPLIAIGGISHESDSFNPAKTTYADFTTRPNRPIAKTLHDWGKSNDIVSGYVAGAQRYGLDLYPTMIAQAIPKGPVTDDAFNRLMAELIRQLKAAPKLDGLLLDLHGAMFVESYPVGDAEVVRRLREVFPKPFPIIVTHDFHANVSPEIVKLSTVLITYKEDPHLDTHERGIQAAKVMSEIVSGKVKPVQVIVKPPMLYNIVFQNTFAEPLKPIVAEERRLEENPKILAVSVPGGYQYADSPALGPSVIVATDNDPALAQKEAQRLSDMLWATRNRLVLHLPDAAEGVRRAIASDKAPVVLVDMGDNIGGGSPGDSTFVLSELLRQKAQGWVVVLADPQAVQIAARAGVNGAFDELVGGKTDNMHGKPVRVRGRVKSLDDGRWVELQVRHGGQRYYNQGLTAVIEAEGSTPDLPNLLMLTTRRQVPFSLGQLTSCGIYPERQKILAVKAAIAYRAAYEPVAKQIIELDTPGVTAVNPARFKYTRARRPMFGLGQ